MPLIRTPELEKISNEWERLTKKRLEVTLEFEKNLKLELKKIDEQIKELQQSCPHTNKYTSNARDACDRQKTCQDCGKKF